jgi:hypothetical protein
MLYALDGVGKHVNNAQLEHITSMEFVELLILFVVHGIIKMEIV